MFCIYSCLSCDLYHYSPVSSGHFGFSAGASCSSGHFGSSIFKIADDGTIFRANGEGVLIAYEYSTITSVKETDIPTKYNLSQNYPNPFNPSTTIKYSIPKQSTVTLKVFDVLGSEVATIVNGEQSQGKYEVEFDSNNLTSGIYFYRLHVGDYVNTRKMILLK